jgi:hypothetical protein
VNQTVKRLETHGLIQRIDTHKTQPGKRAYTLFYSLSPTLKSQIKGDRMAEPFTACRVHNLRKKIHIISQSAPVTKDKRANYSKSWFMKGNSERYKFWFVGKAGMPSVTVDIHPGTIVAYCDSHQFITAKNPEEAMEIGWRAIYAAVDKFVELQGKFGIIIDVPHVGETIGVPHGGFATSEENLKEGIKTPGWWGDQSTGKPELETAKKDGMGRLDRLIQISEEVDLTALPEMFRGMIDPLHADITALSAHIQGGNTIQYQINQQNTLILKLIEHITQLEKRLGEK